MKTRDEGSRTLLEWRRAAVATFALGLVVGVGLPWVRFVLRGDPDPFNDGWPLYLHAGAFAGAFAITLLVRRPIAAALGLYCGLVAYVLVSGASEYPMSSCIALAVHALIPASAGAFLGYLVPARTREKV